MRCVFACLFLVLQGVPSLWELFSILHFHVSLTDQVGENQCHAEEPRKRKRKWQHDCDIPPPAQVIHAVCVCVFVPRS